MSVFYSSHQPIQSPYAPPLLHRRVLRPPAGAVRACLSEPQASSQVRPDGGRKTREARRAGASGVASLPTFLSIQESWSPAGARPGSAQDETVYPNRHPEHGVDSRIRGNDAERDRNVPLRTTHHQMKTLTRHPRRAFFFSRQQVRSPSRIKFGSTRSSADSISVSRLIAQKMRCAVGLTMKPAARSTQQKTACSRAAGRHAQANCGGQAQ